MPALITDHLLLCIILLYLLIINIVAFLMMYADKQKAKNHAWRIPEANLFLSALLGGSIGAILGMQKFRHKTKHWYFVWGMPAILMIQIIVAIVLFLKLN